MAYLNGRRILVLLKPSTLQKKIIAPPAVTQSITEDTGFDGLTSGEVKAAPGEANKGH